MKKVYTTKDVRRILTQQIPDLKISSLEYLSSGSNCDVFICNNLYIFKFSKHEKGSQDLLREKTILEIIHDIVPISVPKIEFMGTISENNYLFIGYTQLKGTFLNRKIFSQLTLEEQDCITQDIANFLQVLHNIKIANIDSLVLNTIDKYQNDLEYIKKNCLQDFGPDIISKINDFYYDLFNSTTFFDYKNCIIHNDLGTSNILIDNTTKKICAIIDFSDTAYSDPDNDFNLLLSNAKDEMGRDFGLKVLKYYNHPNIDLVLKKADFFQLYWMFDGLILGHKCQVKKWIKESAKAIKKYFTYK